jgi:hypothetical protein
MSSSSESDVTGLSALLKLEARLSEANSGRYGIFEKANTMMEYLPKLIEGARRQANGILAAQKMTRKTDLINQGKWDKAAQKALDKEFKEKTREMIPQMVEKAIEKIWGVSKADAELFAADFSAGRIAI